MLDVGCWMLKLGMEDFGTHFVSDCSGKSRSENGASEASVSFELQQAHYFLHGKAGKKIHAKKKNVTLAIFENPLKDYYEKIYFSSRISIRF